MEEKDPNDTELGILSKDTEVVHAQRAGLVWSFLELNTRNNLHPLPKH